MKIVATKIAGVARIETSPVADSRGAFARLFCVTELSPLLGERRIAQINFSRTRAVGALRGMHFQNAPHAEMKFIRCLRGRVWDVAVDLRAGSPTFLGWHAEELAADSLNMLVIPEGCAHGFQALEPDSELLYLHTANYVPESEGGVAHDDAHLNIRWPLPITDISTRDRQLPTLPPRYAGMPS